MAIGMHRSSWTGRRRFTSAEAQAPEVGGSRVGAAESIIPKAARRFSPRVIQDKAQLSQPDTAVAITGGHRLRPPEAEADLLALFQGKQYHKLARRVS